MTLSALQAYVKSILTLVPWGHWALMVVGSLALALAIRKKCSVYGLFALGITLFIGLFLLDTAVIIRYLGIMRHATGVDLTLDYFRMFQKSGEGPMESFSNIAVFVPFGFFLAEFLAEYRGAEKQVPVWRRLGLVTSISLFLSLSIECLQLLLQVGFFEVTDLVMNTIGGFLGASVAIVGRELYRPRRTCTSRSAG